MDEYWVCHHCRSLNRAGSGRCYSCKKKFGSKPKEMEISRPGPSTGNRPAAGTGAAASGSTARPVVLSSASASGSGTGSQNSSSQIDGELPSYFSRPTVVQSEPAPYLTDVKPRRRLPNPLSPIERRIAAALAVRPSVSVTGLGYATIGLMAFVVLLAGLIALLGLPALSFAIQHADVPGGWNQLDAGARGLLTALAYLEVIAGVAMLVAFSIFVGLSTHNLAGLGAETTLLLPRSAGTVWWSAAWFQLRVALGLLLPTYLVYQGYVLPALVLGLLVVEMAQHHAEDSLDWLERPAHHLPELYRKFGIEGAKRSPLATAWAILFRVANLLVAGACLLPPLALVAAVAMKASGHQLDVWQQADGYGVAQLLIWAALAVAAVSIAASLIATIFVVLGLVNRQRTRRTLVRVGRSRSWLTRPGEGTYGTTSAPGAAGAGGAGAGAAAALGGMAGAAALGGMAGAAHGASYGDAAAPASMGAFGASSGGYGDEEERFVDRYPHGTFPPGYRDDSFSARVAERQRQQPPVGGGPSGASGASGPSAGGYAATSPMGQPRQPLAPPDEPGSYRVSEPLRPAAPPARPSQPMLRPSEARGAEPTWRADRAALTPPPAVTAPTPPPATMVAPVPPLGSSPTITPRYVPLRPRRSESAQAKPETDAEGDGEAATAAAASPEHAAPSTQSAPPPFAAPAPRAPHSPAAPAAHAPTAPAAPPVPQAPAAAAPHAPGASMPRWPSADEAPRPPAPLRMPPAEPVRPVAPAQQPAREASPEPLRLKESDIPAGLARLPEPIRPSLRMPEGWAGPKPGGLLSRVNAQMPAEPQSDRPQEKESGAPDGDSA